MGMEKATKQYSLRGIVLFTVSTIVLLFLAASMTITRVSMSRMLTQSEDRYLEKQMSVVESGLESFRREIFLAAKDLSVWNETDRFARGENPNYLERNWPDSTVLERYHFNFIYIKDREGSDRYVEFRDYIEDKPTVEPEGFSEHLNGISGQVLQQADREGPNREEAGRSGLVFFDDVPYYVVAMPVRSNQGETPSGTLILGCVWSNEFFRNGTHQDMDFAVIPQDADSRPASIRRENSDTVSTTLPLTDLDGRPAALVVTDYRIIYSEGQNTIILAMVLLLAAVIALLLLLYFVIDRLVLRQVKELSMEIAGLTEGGATLENRSKTQEISMLRQAINGMLERLNHSRISLEVFTSILSGIDSFVYVTDLETDEILFLNEKLAEQYGVDSSQVVGKVCWKLLPGGQQGRCSYCPVSRLNEDPESTVQWIHDSKITGRQYQKVDRVIGWGGRKAHLQCAVDITELKIAEQTLKKRLEQQELMFAISQSFISTENVTSVVENALRMAGKFLDASKIVIAAADWDNKTLRRRFGWFNQSHGIQALGESKGIPFTKGQVTYDMFYEEGLPYIVCSDATTRPEFDYLVRFGVKSFVIAPIRVSGRFWGIITVDDCTGNREWEQGDIHLIRLIGSVISELITRSETGEELVRMSSLVDRSPQAAAYVEESGAVVYVNKGFEALTGYTREDVREDGIYRLLEEEVAREVRKVVDAVKQGGGGSSYEVPVIRKDGACRDMLVSVFAVGQEAFGLGVIASDITEMRQMERELVVAKEQAEQSNQAKSDFLSRMSHEMRTPMNAIIGMTSIAKTSGDPERKEYCLDKIQDASTHLLGVINDILDMSKIESGKFELSYSEFDFEKMLMKVTGVINFRVDEKKLNFMVKVDRDVPAAIVSDEQRLTQVLTNLLSNAVKFTPEEGDVSLFVRKLGEEDGLCTLQMEVRDTGIGIAPEQQGKLFRSFEQADGGISRRFGGTGLGLAISKSIVEMMGGRIWVDSEADKGSSFFFTVRARRGTPAQSGDRSFSWDSLRVMAVDDAPEVLEYFSSIAESLRLRCDVASDGFEACRKLEDTHYDILFVDWKMPGMDGIELARRVKETYGGNTIVIMISAAEWSAIEPEARTVGVDRFLPKPLFASTIADCINECLGAPDKSGRGEEEQEAMDDFSDFRILLAEDVEINREILIALLEPTGIVMDCAEDGGAAYRMFAENPDGYDMIFMDIHMPEVDGYEATRMIRDLGIPRAKEVPIVAMTANVFREDVERCLAAGMNDHLGKPLDMAEVLNKLRRYLRNDC